VPQGCDRGQIRHLLIQNGAGLSSFAKQKVNVFVNIVLKVVTLRKVFFQTDSIFKLRITAISAGQFLFNLIESLDANSIWLLFFVDCHGCALVFYGTCFIDVKILAIYVDVLGVSRNGLLLPNGVLLAVICKNWVRKIKCGYDLLLRLVISFLLFHSDVCAAVMFFQVF